MNELQKTGPDFSLAGPVEYAPAAAGGSGLLEKLLANEEARLLAIPGVISVGICIGHPGGEALAVGVVDAGVEAHLPREINGVPLVVTVTGPVDALRPR